MSDDIVVMLRTPVGCTPPSKWELAAADEIERLRRRVAVLEMVIDEELDQFECEDAANEMIVKEIHDRGYAKSSGVRALESK